MKTLYHHAIQDLVEPHGEIIRPFLPTLPLQCICGQSGFHRCPPPRTAPHTPPRQLRRLLV